MPPPVWNWDTTAMALPPLGCLVGAAWVAAHLRRCGRGGWFALIGLWLLTLAFAVRAAGGFVVSRAWAADGPGGHSRAIEAMDAAQLFGIPVGTGFLLAGVTAGRRPWVGLPAGDGGLVAIFVPRAVGYLLLARAVVLDRPPATDGGDA